jgi:hypothetical protein
MKATQALYDLGQCTWLDNITRDLLDSGTLLCCSHASGQRVQRIAPLHVICLRRAACSLRKRPPIASRLRGPYRVAQHCPVRSI